MNQDVSSRDYSSLVISAVQEPWTYIGAGAAHLSNIAGKAGQALADASNLASQIRSGFVSEAQKYQAASKLWSDLKNGLSYELDGMRGRLSASEQRWADKAVDAMQSAYVLDDLVATKGGDKFANAFLDFSRNIGGIVSAFQLISELNKSDVNGNGPSTNDVIKSALGVGVGLLFTAAGLTSLPAIVAAAVVGVVVDVSWSIFSKNNLSEDFRNSRFFDIFFDFFTGKNVSGQMVSSTLGNTPDPLVKTIRYVWVDPLILDLDGDGIEITPLARKIQFDINGDGIKTGTAWVQADDGLLVWDRNGNGLIDSGRELFGDETLLANGQKAAHGFAALSELDVGGAVNAGGGAGDGVFDAKDAQYASLRIWRDLNQDGVSQANELQTLALPASSVEARISMWLGGP